MRLRHFLHIRWLHGFQSVTDLSGSYADGLTVNGSRCMEELKQQGRHTGVVVGQIPDLGPIGTLVTEVELLDQGRRALFQHSVVIEGGSGGADSQQILRRIFRRLYGAERATQRQTLIGGLYNVLARVPYEEGVVLVRPLLMELDALKEVTEGRRALAQELLVELIAARPELGEGVELPMGGIMSIEKSSPTTDTGIGADRGGDLVWAAERIEAETGDRRPDISGPDEHLSVYPFPDKATPPSIPATDDARMTSGPAETERCEAEPGEATAEYGANAPHVSAAVEEPFSSVRASSVEAASVRKGRTEAHPRRPLRSLLALAVLVATVAVGITAWHGIWTPGHYASLSPDIPALSTQQAPGLPTSSPSQDLAALSPAPLPEHAAAPDESLGPADPETSTVGTPSAPQAAQSGDAGRAGGSALTRTNISVTPTLSVGQETLPGPVILLSGKFSPQDACLYVAVGADLPDVKGATIRVNKDGRFECAFAEKPPEGKVSCSSGGFSVGGLADVGIREVGFKCCPGRISDQRCRLPEGENQINVNFGAAFGVEKP